MHFIHKNVSKLFKTQLDKTMVLSKFKHSGQTQDQRVYQEVENPIEYVFDTAPSKLITDWLLYFGSTHFDQ